MIDIVRVSLLDLLPSNVAKDPNIKAAAIAIDRELDELIEEIRQLPRFSRMDELTDEEVDDLAWEFHVDFYDPTLPLQQRRELVKNAIPWHRRKATPSAIEELVTSLFGEGKVEEWFEYGGQPYHYRVITNNPDVTTSKAQEFIKAVESVTRLSARLEKIVISQTENMNLYFAGALHMGEKLTIEQVVT
ncbi:phage tail protein I [Paenibacillus sp. 481]|uniref:phage tail protein I n=1 Tax=Paenibacillus sp. 481 TaxID=2835869 RepID=UPI001E62C532|nr:phage tail protein I [Paenibacillus sp. 481]UHA74453.1 phage tail protein I [Paenibacillus sp. 481]